MKVWLIFAGLISFNALASERSIERAIEYRNQQYFALKQCISGQLSLCSCSSLENEAKAINAYIENLDYEAKAPYRECVVNAYLGHMDDRIGGVNRYSRQQQIDKCVDLTQKAVNENRLNNSAKVDELRARAETVLSRASQVSCSLNL